MCLVLSAWLKSRGTQGNTGGWSLAYCLRGQRGLRSCRCRPRTERSSIIDFFAAKCPYRTLKIRMKSAIECHIHAVFAGLVKPDDVCGLGWQQGMFLVLGLKNRCLVKNAGASCLVEGTGAWSKKQVLRAWLREQVLGQERRCFVLG